MVRFCCRPGGGKKRHILYDFNIFMFCIFFNFLRNSKNTRHRRFPVRFCCRPGGGKQRHILYDFNIFMFLSFSIYLQISKNTRYRRFWHHFWCRPRGGKKRHILYDFNNFIFCIFFNFFAKFKKHKVTEIPGALLVPSRRRQKSTHPIGF